MQDTQAHAYRHTLGGNKYTQRWRVWWSR